MNRSSSILSELNEFELGYFLAVGCHNGIALCGGGHAFDALGGLALLLRPQFKGVIGEVEKHRIQVNSIISFNALMSGPNESIIFLGVRSVSVLTPLGKDTLVIRIVCAMPLR